MNLIACVDENFNIGCDNKLLFNIKKDMQFFKSKTLNNVVIMGRKTLESLPNSAPLPNRINIVLTSKHNFDGCICVKDLNQLLDTLKNYSNKDIYVIGGEQIYNLLLPYSKKAFITKVYTTKIADTKFPNIEKLDNWNLIESVFHTENDLDFSFNVYLNNTIPSKLL